MVDRAESALERAKEAVRAGWDETRDSRINALGSAKQAVRQSGEAIDRSVEAARGRWQPALERLLSGRWFDEGVRANI